MTMPEGHSATTRLAGGREGFALIVVVWVLTLLSLIATSFTTSMRTETSVAANMIEDTRWRAHVEAGVHLGIAALSAEALPEGWGLDGRPVGFEFDGATLTVALQSESGKHDLNAGSDELLLNLLQSAGADDDLAATLLNRIHDWRDEDDLRRVNGAEAEDYAEAGLSHVPADRDFRSVDELRFVLGMPPEVFRRLRGAVTVHSGLASPVWDVAPELVLLALADGDQAAAQAIALAREQGVAGGADFHSPVTTVSAGLSGNIENDAILEAVVWLTPEGDRPFRIVDWYIGPRTPAATE